MSEDSVKWKLWNKYEVSTEGVVRRAAPGKGTVVGYEIKRSMMHGRPVMAVMVDGKRMAVRLGALMAEVWLGGVPEGKKVGYRDGDVTNCRLENLELVPSRGKRPTKGGRRGPKPKLTDEQVKEIRRLWQEREAAWLTGGIIAKRFGVSESMVNRIVNRRAWAHLE